MSGFDHVLILATILGFVDSLNRPGYEQVETPSDFMLPDDLVYFEYRKPDGTITVRVGEVLANYGSIVLLKDYTRKGKPRAFRTSEIQNSWRLV